MLVNYDLPILEYFWEKFNRLLIITPLFIYISEGKTIKTKLLRQSKIESFLYQQCEYRGLSK